VSQEVPILDQVVRTEVVGELVPKRSLDIILSEKGKAAGMSARQGYGSMTSSLEEGERQKRHHAGLTGNVDRSGAGGACVSVGGMGLAIPPDATMGALRRVNKKEQ
jgi:hypothetical protein